MYEEVIEIAELSFAVAAMTMSLFNAYHVMLAMDEEAMDIAKLLLAFAVTTLLQWNGYNVAVLPWVVYMLKLWMKQWLDAKEAEAAAVAAAAAAAAVADDDDAASDDTDAGPHYGDSEWSEFDTESDEDW